jgi:hypothetical protein
LLLLIVFASLERLKGLAWHARQTGRATIRIDLNPGEAGKTFFGAGLAMHNLGDVDMQMVAFAVGAGMHGSGKRLPISGQAENVAANLMALPLGEGK